MPILRRSIDYRTLSEAELVPWASASTATTSDALNRSQSLGAAISGIKPGMRVAGQARTVAVPPGDNAAIHIALSLCRPGEVLVVSGGGAMDTAIWGEIMTEAARALGLAGVVLDGTTRDRARIAELDFPTFSRGSTPRGPQKGSLGEIDAPVAISGVVVNPGDLVLGDDDGVTIVPLSKVEATLSELRRLEEREAQILKEIAAGKLTTEIFGFEVPHAQ